MVTCKLTLNGSKVNLQLIAAISKSHLPLHMSLGYPLGSAGLIYSTQ